MKVEGGRKEGRGSIKNKKGGRRKEGGSRKEERKVKEGRKRKNKNKKIYYTSETFSLPSYVSPPFSPLSISLSHSFLS
jgi:hypothetical protein